MKNLKNIKKLKLANNNIIKQNQCYSNKTKMRINGQIILTPILPMWKINILDYDKQFYSTINKDIKYKELIVKQKYLVQEQLDNLIKESSKLFYNKPNNGVKDAAYIKYNLMVDNIGMKIQKCKDLIKD